MKSVKDAAETGRAILVVEDDPLYRDILTTKLIREGFRVIASADGLDCVRLALDAKPSLILLDIILPLTDGITILKDLKAEPRTVRVPVIILTNLVRYQDRAECAALGAEQCLVKTNVTPSEIVAQVRRVLALVRPIKKPPGRSGGEVT